MTPYSAIIMTCYVWISFERVRPNEHAIIVPCGITVVEHENGRVQLIAMNMALIARLFNNDQLRDYAQELNNVQLQIIEEVTF